jgi:hypothetical protein
MRSLGRADVVLMLGLLVACGRYSSLVEIPDSADEDSALTTVPSSVLAAPATLRATSDNASVTLAWTAVTATNFLGYAVYRGTDVTKAFVRLNPTPVTTASYVDTAVVNGTTYFYRVRALNTLGQRGPRSDTVSATPGDDLDGAAPSGPTGTSGGSSGSTGSTGSTGLTGSTGSPGGTTGTTSGADLCAGLVQDLTPRYQTALAKPALGQTVTDAQFGTKIRRITAASSTDIGIKPMYSTMPAWNADESLMILFRVGSGDHLLYDGKTYQFIRVLNIQPADLEQVFWHTSDPDILFYPEAGGSNFIRYHVKAGTREVLTSFAGTCAPNEYVTNGGDPIFTSWDSKRVGLACGSWTTDWSTYTGKMFTYDISTNTVLGVQQLAPMGGTPTPAQFSASGNFLYYENGSGQVLDPTLKLVRSLALVAPDNHGSLGQLQNGHDTWNTAVYDPFTANNDHNEVGSLVSWDLNTGTSRVIIGPLTGYPYPPDGHISAVAYKRPGWVTVSTISSNTTGQQGLLDQEILVADTNTGKVCRVGRHRSWGKNNPTPNLGYWAEPHAVPSPSGTRILFGSDWGGGSTVDAYVVELPSYAP